MLNDKLSIMLSIWQYRHPGQGIPPLVLESSPLQQPCYTQDNKVISRCIEPGCLSAIVIETPVCSCGNYDTNAKIEGEELRVVCSYNCNNPAPPLYGICPSSKHPSSWVQYILGRSPD